MRSSQPIMFRRYCSFIRSGWKDLKEVLSTDSKGKERQTLNSSPTVAGYLRDIRKVMNEYDYRGAFYGHFGHGCIHMRVSFDLESEERIRKYSEFIDRAADLVVSYGGSLSGEHGDGQSRAALLPKMFGAELMEAFVEFKAAWDPDNKLNPHKVVDAYMPTENLRLGADYKPLEPETHFKFPDDDGYFGT